MKQPDHVCRINFIPQDQVKKGSATVRTQNIISQFIFMDEFTIGSSKDANIVYKSKGVHHLHCKIIVKGKQIFVTDLFSSQGVLVNGSKITVGTPFPVKPEEYIQLGSSQDVITIELFRKPGNPKEEGASVLVEAEAKARSMIKEAEQISKEAATVEEKTSKLIAEAEAKANDIVLEKKREMQQQFEEKLKQAIEEGHQRANEIIGKAEKDVETLKVEMESKSFEMAKHREREAQSIVTKAQERAEEIIAAGKSEVAALLTEAQAKAESIAASGETRKSEALKERAEVFSEITQLHKQVEDIRANIAEVTEENKNLMAKNAQLLADTKNFSAKYETADAEFQEYVAKLTDEKNDLTQRVNEIRADLVSAKDELAHLQSKNEAVKSDTKLNEGKNKDLVTQIQKQQQALLDVKNEIQLAFRQKEQAVKELEVQRQKTQKDIAHLKKDFEEEYKRRKGAIEQRFSEIRRREQLAAQERRDLLKKHEKERLPFQVKNIATAIWNDLSIELQDQSAKAEFFSADKGIPKTIEKIVEKSVFEEHDLRSKIGAKIPLYKEEDPKQIALRKMGEGFTLTGIGAAFMFALIWLASPWPKSGESTELVAMGTKVLERDKLKQASTIAKVDKRSSASVSRPQTDKDWRQSYTNNVLYNRFYDKFLSKQSTDANMEKRLASFMGDSLKLSLQQQQSFKEKEKELIDSLKTIRRSFNDGNRKQKITEMKELEKTYRVKLYEILGDGIKYGSYQSFQRKEFELAEGL